MSKRRDIYKLIDEHIENKTVAKIIKEYIANQAGTQKELHDKMRRKRRRKLLKWRKNY